jgi:radical SAM superfamily enzyme YgiQ (UPF0313 family)
MKVLLVATNRVLTPFPVYPIGVDYVATALRAKHEVRVLDLAVEPADVRLQDTCRAFRPDVVGLSIRNVDSTETSNPDGFIPDIERVVALVRATCKARIVLGGPGFSIFPQALMQRLQADFGLIGEGERLPELLEAMESVPDRMAELPGVLVRDRDAAPVEAWTGAHPRTLASAETVGHYLRWGGMLNIQTKRGCPFVCGYCTYPSIEGHGLRLFDPDDVAREWESLLAAGAKFIFVTDAVFNSDVDHNLAVAEALRSRGLTTPWGAFFAPIRPRPDYYRRLREVGLTHAEFGTESLAPLMLERYCKPFTVEHALAAHRDARAAGVHVAHYLLLGGPGETPETLARTLDRCEELDDAALFFFCGVRIYPSTPLHALALREGQVDPNEDLLMPRFYRPAGISLDAILAEVKRRAKGRTHWVLGSGDDRMVSVQRRMYERGHIGPLWDRLVF